MAPKRVQTTETIGALSHTRRVKLERRNGSPRIYARTHLHGRRWLYNTGTTNLRDAEREALQWYMTLLARGALSDGSLEPLDARTEVLFADAVQSFLAHADRVKEVTDLQRRNYRHKWSLLEPHFDGVALTDIDTTWLERLRNQRKAKTVNGKPISNSTIKKDFSFISLVLRHAVERDKTLDRMPMFPAFRGRVWKDAPNQRPYLPPDLWKRVKATAKARISEHVTKNRLTAARVRKQRTELYAYILMCVGAALRVEEADSLRWKDCRLGKWDDGTEYVHLWVHGHHATTPQREEGWAMYDGVVGFRLLKRLYPDAKPDDKLFRESHRDAMRELLEAAGVREDVVRGMTRDRKSLRQTGISLRLDMGPDPSYNDIAKWARTSPVQIASFYDQIHPETAVKRIAGFRKTGDAGLDSARAQLARESTMDDDSVYGEDQETGDEPS
jgi:hypothetical protein